MPIERHDQNSRQPPVRVHLQHHGTNDLALMNNNNREEGGNLPILALVASYCSYFYGGIMVKVNSGEGK